MISVFPYAYPQPFDVFAFLHEKTTSATDRLSPRSLPPHIAATIAGSVASRHQTMAFPPRDCASKGNDVFLARRSDKAPDYLKEMQH
jgi:hypothetical protein